MFALNLVMKNKQTNPNWGTFFKTTWLNSSNMSLLWNIHTEARQSPRLKTKGTSLGVQWLRLHTHNARGLGSIPGQRTRSHMHACIPKLCLTLCNPTDCSPQGSHPWPGIFQARTPKWVAISFTRGSSPPRAGRFFTTEPPGLPLVPISLTWEFACCN